MKKQDELPRRPLYLYDLPPEVLDTLSLKTDADGQEQQIPEQNTETSPDASSNSTAENAVGSKACSLCSATFPTVQEQKSHLRSDFHHYNLKQKIRSLNPVSEAEFEKLIGDLDESLSGSDSPDTEDDEPARKDTTLSALLKKQATLADKKNDNDAVEVDRPKNPRGSGKPPLIWFGSPTLPEDNYFGIYRAMFSSEELQKEEEILEAIKKRQLAPIAMPKPGKNGAPPTSYKGPHIFLCMIGGGHFAAMVVSLAPRQTKHSSVGPLNREATVLAHKTFHRYTTRRKQGGSQSANDSAKGAAHSAGSSLRRYNEQALVEDVRELLQEWKGLLDTSDLLFIRATGTTNRRTLFGPYDGQVLRQNDPRIRGYPFSTRRATQNELMRAYIELTRLKVREITPVVAAPETAKASGASTPTKASKPTAPKLSEEEETALLHTSQLQALIRRSKLPALLSYLTTNSLAPNFAFYPPDTQHNHHAPTPLHLAASQNSPALVTGLLVRGGADPTVTNTEGRTAFELAGDRATRDAFRVARSELGEDRWGWDDGARVPAPLNRSDAEARVQREKAEEEAAEAKRRKAEEERLKVEGPQVPAGYKGWKGSAVMRGRVIKTAEEKREEEGRGMTPLQLAMLERERRARAAEARMRKLQGGGFGE